MDQNSRGAALAALKSRYPSLREQSPGDAFDAVFTGAMPGDLARSTWGVVFSGGSPPGPKKRGVSRADRCAVYCVEGRADAVLVVTPTDPNQDGFVRELRDGMTMTRVHWLDLRQLLAEAADAQADEVPSGDGAEGTVDADDTPLGPLISTKLGSRENAAAQEALAELAKSIREANAPILRACRNDMLAVSVENFEKLLTTETVSEKFVKYYKIPLVFWLADKVFLPDTVRAAAAKAWQAVNQLFPHIHILP